MRTNKVLRIQMIITVLVLILQTIFPVFSIAEENENCEITVSRERVENTNILTIRDVVAKITDVRIVYGEKIEESNYFLDEERNLIEGKGEELEFTTVTETEELHEINASFDIRDNCYEYTVFIFDENKNGLIYNYSIEQNTITIKSVTSSENNKKELTINVSDTASNISLIKIAKVHSEDEQVDFEKQGIIIGENYNAKEVVENYTVQEDGIYKIYAENEEKQGFIWTTRVYSENPIIIDWKQDETEKNKLIFNIQDKLCDVTSVKVAKYDVNTEIDWENATVIYPREQEVDLENLTCYVAEEGKYSIRVEDSQGFSYVKTTSRIYFNDENKPVIKLHIDRNNLDIVNIVATDNLFEITEMNVAVGENLELEEIQEKATSIEITKGNIVEASYPVQNEKTMYVYCIAEDGQGFILEADFNAIEIIGEEQPEEEPEQEEPEQDEPEQEKPEQNEPEQDEPEQEKPEQNEPEQDEPEQDEPEQEEPEQEEPEQDEPEQNEPEQDEPEQDKPEQDEPEQNEPEQEQPEQNEPEQDEPEQDEPEQEEPEQEEPEQDEPEQNEPEQDEPEQDKTEQDEPEQNEPEQEQPKQEEIESGKVNGNKTEVKDSTTSDKPLPQTGIQAGILVIIGALSINSIIMLRKILKNK